AAPERRGRRILLLAAGAFHARAPRAGRGSGLATIARGRGWVNRGAEGLGAGLSLQFSPLRLRLLQPVRHAHLAVHRRRGGEMLLGLLTLVRAVLAKLARACR